MKRHPFSFDVRIRWIHRESILCFYPWWPHQMEIFSALLALCAGNSSVTGKSPPQRPVTRSFDVFYDLCKIWTNGSANIRDTSDLRRHCTHYDAAVMYQNVNAGVMASGYIIWKRYFWTTSFHEIFFVLLWLSCVFQGRYLKGNVYHYVNLLML